MDDRPDGLRHRLDGLMSAVGGLVRRCLEDAMLGRTEPTWDDMAADVIHITRGTSQHDSFQNIISILDQGLLEARSAFGAGRRYCPDPRSQHAVCFTEVPVHKVRRIINRRLPPDPAAWNGIAFAKTFIVARGGGPIMYAYDGTPHAKALEKLIATAMWPGAPADHPIWELTPYIDMPGKGGSYFFEWEREWRHKGDLRFDPSDVAFLIVPEQFHADAQRHFAEVNLGQRSGRAYWVPLLDATWSLERCQQELKRVRRPPAA